MKVVAVVQARMGSTRLPNKVMRPICGTPMIGLLLDRLKLASRVDDVLLATSSDERNRPLVDYVAGRGIDVYQGSEHDVLDRYYHAAMRAGAEVVVRITGDCPLIDAGVIDDVVSRFFEARVDYASNTLTPTYPDGLDTEVFTFAALADAWRDAHSPYEREHVTPYLKHAPHFQRANVAHEVDWSAERWTVDEPEDFDLVTRVFTHFEPRRDFRWLDVLELRNAHPEWFVENRHFARDEGARLGKGQKLWKRAKRVIPGGSMLLSKRAEMYLPDQWPAYFSRAQGCRVWDLDGREFIDMCLMGVGTNSLGYAHPEVDAAVRDAIASGNMSTLNCPEEVHLAERLVDLHPWADMVRFARSGGEANAIAIRIARAASGRDTVAFCGYHGWHDWYLAANLANADRLAGHLLPGLEPRGVPQHLRGSVVPFRFNDLPGLRRIVSDPQVGVIKMEVTRNVPPDPGFLQQVRDIATERGIVLVFDECTSGFRQSFGGLHLIHGVEPDVAVFGKALGNGYAITAVVGRRGVMDTAQSTFISSTFWTERIGPAAALKTLDVMERVRSWEQITVTGQEIARRWQALADKHGLPVEISGIPSMTSFSFPVPDMLKYKTLITQEMLKAGFLATNTVYVCTEHTPEVVDRYFDALDPLFGMIRDCEDGRSVDALLEGPVCHAGFTRLN